MDGIILQNMQNTTASISCLENFTWQRREEERGRETEKEKNEETKLHYSQM
jgi:hypothetical protein